MNYVHGILTRALSLAIAVASCLCYNLALLRLHTR